MSMNTKLKVVREYSGLTLEELGEKLNCSKQNVQQRMNRNFTMEFLLQFVETCGFRLKITSPDGDVVMLVREQDCIEDK